jgi:hypothetical protein
VVEVGIALDDIVEISDFSNTTILALATRLDASTSFGEIIAREIELDELWRRVDTGRKDAADAPGADEERQVLETIFALVWQAHDLTGDGQPAAAAARLREATAQRTDIESGAHEGN